MITELNMQHLVNTSYKTHDALGRGSGQFGHQARNIMKQWCYLLVIGEILVQIDANQSWILNVVIYGEET